MRGDRFLLPDRQLGVEEEEEADDDDDDEEEAKVVRRRRAARCCDASLEARLRSVRSTSSVAILDPDDAKAEAMSKDSASESGGAGRNGRSVRRRFREALLLLLLLGRVRRLHGDPLLVTVLAVLDAAALDIRGALGRG